MSAQRIGIALLAILLLSIFRISPVEAQDGGWSKPYRLSTDAGRAGPAFLMSDQYGFVHSFWTETLFEDERTIFQYARFDGVTWTAPNDFYITTNGIEDMSAVVDQYGMLHMVWTEGTNGPVYYAHAPAANAQLAQNWSRPLPIDIPAGVIRFEVDSKGIFHILYVNRIELGVYYVESEDQGLSWSKPIWLDPDILPNHTPGALNFDLDSKDGLHAVWWYGALDQSQPDWVRYIHSLDGGHTWSKPILLDRYNKESNHNLTVAGPHMIVQDQTVHVIWAAGSLPYRNHRYSTDAGLTWSKSVQKIFGDLHGQAGDGLTLDAAGRVHFIGQIRYPMGIYHAYWDHNQWSKASLIYFIAEEGSEDDFGERIHAHSTVPIIRAGNQLVLTFNDGPAEPKRRLFVMYRTLSDISPLENMPTPTATVAPIQSPTPGEPTTMPNQTATALALELAQSSPIGDSPAPDFAIQVALIPTLLVLGVAVLIQFFSKRKR